MSDNGESEQTRFRNGRVERDPSSGDRRDAPVHPNRATGYAVSIKSGALEVNHRLVEVRDEYGETLTFADRETAEAFAHRLSSDGGDLRIQAAAPNDPDEVDAYLLADHQPSVHEPAAVDGDSLTFDVGANLYGVLGEAVVSGGPTSPALEHFVKQDLANRSLEDRLRLRVTEGEFVSFPDDGTDPNRWMPDCCVEARDGWRGRLVERYWCEIKTGDASFERTQVAAMRELAKESRVLKVRVLIEDLPEQYTVRIREVDSPG